MVWGGLLQTLKAISEKSKSKGKIAKLVWPPECKNGAQGLAAKRLRSIDCITLLKITISKPVTQAYII